MRARDLSAAIAALIPTSQPFFVKGPPGVGKSSLAFQAASKVYDGDSVASAVGGFPQVPWFCCVRAVDRDPIDFRGVLYVTDGKAQWTIPDLVDKLTASPDGGLLLLEELPQAVPAVQCVLREVLLEHAIGGVPLPKNWSVGATGNRQEDRAGAGRLLSHVASSVVMLNLEVSLDDWQAWAVKRGIEPEIRSFLRFKPEMLHQFDPARELNADPRGWERLSHIYRAIPDALQNEVFAGTVGQAPAGAFLDYVQLYAKLPDPDAILANPNGSSVPTESSVCWALIGSLVTRCSKAAITVVQAAAVYFSRMKPEFAVAGIVDLAQVQPQAITLPEVRQWMASHPHLFG